MKSCVVFAGPSLPAAARPSGPFDWRPPASAGDLLALVADPPDCVVLIDGYFDWRPAVWHKEILLLLEAGSRVVGGASMGALRAAELDVFGMEGAGAIYRAYRDGRLTGDDEVALLHGPEATDWRPLTEPLVEVRATLAAALRQKALTLADARRLLAAAATIHYSERGWTAIRADGRLAAAVDSLFSLWLRGGVVRLKRQDALACLSAALAAPPGPRPMLSTPRTIFIANLAREAGLKWPPARRERREPMPAGRDR